MTVTLSSGLTLKIEQDLASGEAKIVEGSTGETLSETDLEQRLETSPYTDASLDGTRLLGLNRQSARATVFTGQADVLRVLADAGELQELLERAAATEGADATADGALSWLDEQRRLWVGAAHIGSRPLRATRQALDTAQRLASTRRDAHGDLLKALGNRRRAEEQRRNARGQIEFADRLLRWRSVYTLRQRVERAQELTNKLAGSNEAELVVDENKIQAASEKLGAFESGLEVGPLPSGQSAAELQAGIDALPQLPEGDLEPRTDFQAAKERLAEARTSLNAHMQTAPRVVETPGEPTFSADELRSLAEVLTSSPPQVDMAAVADFERTKNARAKQLDGLQRAVNKAGDAYERAKTNYDAAVVRKAEPDELVGLHNAERQRADEFIAATGQQAAFLKEWLSAQEEQAGVMAQEAEVRHHRQRVDTAREQVLAASLEPDAKALRRHAREIDDAEAAQERARHHAKNAAVMRSLRDDHTRAFASLLGRETPAEISDEVVAQTLKAFDKYIAACNERAAVAQQARRRPDLEAALLQRRELEANHQRATADRERQGHAVLEFAIELGLSAGSTAVAAESLHRWVNDQKAKREKLIERREDAAALTQVLSGRELAELQTDLAESIEQAGPEPDAHELPADIDRFRANAVADHDRAINTDGQLGGQIQTLSNELGSVAEAVEAEADADRAVGQVECLAACLDEAIVELKRARDQAYASIAPALQDRMRPWLPRVTNGRYLDVTVEPNDLTMQVTEASGQKRRADRLSHGTTEQIYLLLRMALSEVLSGGTESAPLILDDVTTQSDSARTVAVMELLHELSSEHQVILFTQEDDVVTWAEEHHDPDRDRIIALPAPGL